MDSRSWYPTTSSAAGSVARADAAPPDGSWVSLVEVRFVASSTLAFAAVTACHVLGVGVLAAAVLVGTLVAVSSLTLPRRYAVAAGGCAWAFLTGFVVNALGQLTFSGADLWRCAALMAVGALAASVGTGAQSHPRRRNTAYSTTYIAAISSRAKG